MTLSGERGTPTVNRFVQQSPTCPKIYAAICYVRHVDHPSYSKEDFAFKKAGQTFLRV